MKNRKRLWIWVLTLAAALCLCACSVGPKKQLKDAAEQFLEAVKTFDTEALERYFPEEDGFAWFGKEENIPVLKDYFREVNQGLTYEIREVDEASGTVTVWCRYPDSTEFLGEFMVEVFRAAFSGDLTDGMTDQELYAAYEKMMDAAKEKVTETDAFREAELQISFAKTEEGFLLSQPNDDALLNMMTANSKTAWSKLADNLDSTVLEKEPSEYEKKITCRGQLADCGVLLQLTNENTVSVGDISVQVLFETESGEVVSMSVGYVDYMAAGETVAVPVFCNYGGEAGPSAYSVSLSCEPEPAYESAKGQVAVSHQDGALSVSAEVTNQSGHVLNVVSLVAVYYQGERLAGFEQGDTFNLTAGSTETVELYHPVDGQYQDVAYDRYEIILTQAIYTE